MDEDLKAFSREALLGAEQRFTGVMVNQRLPRCVLVAVSIVCSSASVADPRFGDLPNGSVSTSEMHGVAAEVCRDHLFDPMTRTVKLPTGYRLISAAEAAKDAPTIDALLGAHPRLRNYALGSLCVMSADTVFVDGTLVHSASQMPMAFWWAATEGPRHVDMRGKVGWVQLGSWYPSNTPHRTAILKTDPMAEFVDLELTQFEPDVWRVRLSLPDEMVVAEVRNSGPRTASRAVQPGYMSVPMSGSSAQFFSVFTYFGHIHRAAQVTWQASGTGVFNEAFSIAGESSAFETVFQQGWAARSGLYRFTRE